MTGYLKDTQTEALDRISNAVHTMPPKEASRAIVTILAELPKRDREARIKRLASTARAANERLQMLLDIGDGTAVKTQAEA
jgi:hypothetical protein